MGDDNHLNVSNLRRVVRVVIQADLLRPNSASLARVERFLTNCASTAG